MKRLDDVGNGGEGAESTVSVLGQGQRSWVVGEIGVVCEVFHCGQQVSRVNIQRKEPH